MPEIKPTRVFTKDAPCRKVDLWNCFINPTGLGLVLVVASRGKIGLNAPKYLRKKEFVGVATISGAEYYGLTDEGKKWLTDGLKRELELHPEWIPEVEFYEQLTGRKAPTRRIARPARKPG